MGSVYDCDDNDGVRQVELLHTLFLDDAYCLCLDFFMCIF